MTLTDDLTRLTPQELALVDMLLNPDTIWAPQPGPQLDAYFTEADICFYGGAAGGGKTDLALGLALTAHRRAVIFRRVYPQLKGIIERLKALTYGVGKYNASEHVWRGTLGGKPRVIELESIQHEDDKNNQQGRDRDLHIFDEVVHFSESQVRFVIGWNRTADEAQRTRVLLTGNPPTDPEGEWVIIFFAPWLDEAYRVVLTDPLTGEVLLGENGLPVELGPAQPGELRWFVVDKEGRDLPVISGRPLFVKGVTDQRTGQLMLVQPKSRTFIPARVTDNAYYMKTGYMATLQALPEPLRSQMLEGQFNLKTDDHPWQVIPTAWVEAAQARWTPQRPDEPQSALGVDVAHGGKDKTVLSARYGAWFAEQIALPGTLTPDGDSVAALVMQYREDAAHVFVDATGVGASAYDSLKRLEKIPVTAVVNGAGSKSRDMSGALTFANVRAETYWRLREALDPKKGLDLALPPSRTLKADLCAARWKLTVRGIQVELKEDISARIGRSPDEGDALVMALMTPVVPTELFIPGTYSQPF
ncbi:terminase family protein [Deinococcus alpinitundrae]|uniref:terminase family protein n=1 Tax=Deinococcus alpinitundrae TaxID=468913 RepID=UPI00137B501B|nr:terminase family protein [Deinococcus alpinitundrae]